MIRRAEGDRTGILLGSADRPHLEVIAAIPRVDDRRQIVGVARTVRAASSSGHESRDGLDLDELVGVAEHGHSEQGARDVVVAERVAHDPPRFDEILLAG